MQEQFYKTLKLALSTKPFAPSLSYGLPSAFSPSPALGWCGPCSTTRPVCLKQFSFPLLLVYIMEYSFGYF
ncbi:hypothetical protein LMH87_005907 [Akanthomyces muscarius]|uniref:Uncharacterized protein n=1 Tax=Akanthomyces muscarius TaxID=2231603 RepID=A0A9W8QPS8_AKAMU|nr:hypothetical protein LMH87_005907 [Akanthomyces muscarius]KAJ4164224.1 hypothetical protein LMH87_005907 [Akanthomyces muscarius]